MKWIVSSSNFDSYGKTNRRGKRSGRKFTMHKIVSTRIEIIAHVDSE